MPKYREPEKNIALPTKEKIQMLIADAGELLSIKLTLSMETGLRPVELARLQVRDLDLEHRTVNPTTAKRGNPRTIPMSQAPTQRLHEHMMRESLTPNDLLFSGTDSDHYGKQYRQIRNKLADKLKDPRAPYPSSYGLGKGRTFRRTHVCACSARSRTTQDGFIARESKDYGIVTMINRNMSEIEKSYGELTERFRKWAENRSDIRTVIIVGSRARVDHPADEWADLDMVIVTTDSEHYVSASDWVNNFGKPLLTFIESTSTGNEKERRVLYENMLDVDFAIIPQEKIQGLLLSRSDPRAIAQISNLLGRGVRVLIDKDGLTNQVSTFTASIEEPPSPQPTQDEFLGVVSDFLYHAVFTAKHMRRGELWWTATCLNCHMQHLLLRMIEWHALATHDWKRDTWFRGRFLEEWAHPKAVKELRQAFAHYDKEDIKRALVSTIDLFRRLAAETATNLSYPYPREADENVTQWITTCISETNNSRR